MNFISVLNPEVPQSFLMWNFDRYGFVVLLEIA
jgi:hypothetical protein